MPTTFLHVASSNNKQPNKFIFSFIQAARADGLSGNHLFMLLNGKRECLVKGVGSFSKVLRGIQALAVLRYLIRCSPDIIMCHSIPPTRVIIALIIWKILKRKGLYLVMWGGEVRESLMAEFFKRLPISLLVIPLRLIYARQLDGIVSPYRDDFVAMKNKYQLRRECSWFSVPTFYPVNAYLPVDHHKQNKTDATKILVGSSALPRNKHFLAFEFIRKAVDTDSCSVEVICPLSYGFADYAEEVKKVGFKYFGKSFVPLYEFIPPIEYKKILSTVDIAIFLHEGQQGMGNIRMLLGAGAKVYFADNSFSLGYFRNLGFSVFNASNLSLSRELSSKENNRILAEELFSHDVVVRKIDLLLKDLIASQDKQD